MAALLYYGLLIPVSRLPLSVLLGISRLMFPVVYYLVRYRRKTVEANLRNSFPEKTAAERNRIARTFYRFLCDSLAEFAKLLSIDERGLRRCLTVENPELVNRYVEQGRHVILVCGHYGSWEFFLTGSPLWLRHRVVVIYRALTNPFFERKLREVRSGMGMVPWPIKEMAALRESFADGPPTALVLGADQSPRNPDRAFWTQFLGQETAFFFGAEKYARELDAPVIYFEIRKVVPGRHTARFTLVTDQPQQEEPGAITQGHISLLEETIRREPAYWLWSHKRWKLKRATPKR